MPEFAERTHKEAIELGAALMPKFDADGLVPAVATDHQTGEVLMLAYMNAEALKQTMAIGEAVYYSRSRQELWHKGATSGLVQKVKEIRIDCDQDAIWLRVESVGGASCHVGYRSCFYRALPQGEAAATGYMLTFVEKEKAFDPEKVYGKK